ncbi:fatty acyl-CoA reductase wat-like [Culicoides brevitarsis]|uniref:fatty acyl-CoA reductase wat-like n=1 Tax=Culicoides brevitarsis TaxID=469753 RepID=UPI00307C836F
MENNNEILKGYNVNESPMLEFYRGKTIFITGGTGFLGKLFLEKLLRINVSRIFVLSRPKKGLSNEERLDAIFTGPLFEQLQKTQPNFKSRVTIIDGDLQKIELGMSPADKQLVMEATEVVIHAAADVRFDQVIKTAVETNVRGTRELCRLAEKIRNLVSLVYVSTAYSHCPMTDIQEKFFDPPTDSDKMIGLVENLDKDAEKMFDKVTNELIQPWPNTYVYTKALSEDIIRKFSDRLPLAVVRPSIIIATQKDPLPGWTDNIYGLNGVIVGVSAGLIRIMYLKSSNVADIIPADIVINTVLAAGRQAYVDRYDGQGKVKGKAKVYNCTSGNVNPINYENIYKFAIHSGIPFPPMKCLWHVSFNTTENKLVHWYCKLMYHFLPAFFIDIWLRVIGRTPRLLNLYKKVHKFSTVLEYFSMNTWKFEGTNMRELCTSLTPLDQELFNCDVAKMQWTEYFDTYMKGLRLYINKDPEETIPKAKKRYAKLRYAHKFVVFMYYAFLSLFFYGILKFTGVISMFDEHLPALLK